MKPTRVPITDTVYMTIKTLELGQSFLLVPGVKRNSLYQIARYHGKKVTVRNVKDGIECVRVK